LTFALLAVAAGAAIGAEKELPKDLPAYGVMKPVPAPQVTAFKLDNGMTVWLVPKAGFPKVAFTIAVRGGYAADPKERPGFADVLAATVTQGTRSRTAKQVAEEISAAGGDVSAQATADAIFLSAGVLSSRADAALKLLADLAQNATFSDQEVEIAKSNLVSSLKANEAEAGFLARRALYRAIFGTHPYAITSPTEDSIAQTTAAELRADYARRFRPDRSVLVAVGDFTNQALTPVIRASFASWKAPVAQESIDLPKPAQAVTRTVAYVPRAHSVQTDLYLGVLAPHRSAPDYAAANVANAIFGGMFGSRLVKNIREDKGYTYSPGARIALNRDTGVLITSANVRNPVTGASFNEIAYELNRMATTVPDKQEVESAKRFLIGLTAIRLQSRAAVARQLANLWVDSLPPEELGAESRKIDKVTPEDVQAAGRKYFPASRMTIVAVGEENVIKDELAPFGLEFHKVD
jgi:predicted Zn-dependent peptidase